MGLRLQRCSARAAPAAVAPHQPSNTHSYITALAHPFLPAPEDRFVMQAANALSNTSPSARVAHGCTHRTHRLPALSKTSPSARVAHGWTHRTHRLPVIPTRRLRCTFCPPLRVSACTALRPAQPPLLRCWLCLGRPLFPFAVDSRPPVFLSQPTANPL